LASIISLLFFILLSNKLIKKVKSENAKNLGKNMVFVFG
jgi:hypothetical protein